MFMYIHTCIYNLRVSPQLRKKEKPHNESQTASVRLQLFVLFVAA